MAVCQRCGIILPEYGSASDNPFFGGAQIAGGAAMAFMHGAQDGQKFMGVFMLGIFLQADRTM